MKCLVCGVETPTSPTSSLCPDCLNARKSTEQRKLVLVVFVVFVVAVFSGTVFVMRSCGLLDSRQQVMDSSTDQKWYAGGHLSSARMSEWVQASERDRLATSADFATAALKLKFGSLEAAMQKLGSMDNLRPYVVEMESCITASGVQPDSMTAAAWAEVLQNEKVSDIAAYCAARLKLPD